MSGDSSRRKGLGNAHWESLLADALLDSDPASALQAAGGLEAVDHDGLRMAALLVVKLRFERLIAGSSRAASLFEEDPGGFAALFRRYHADVKPTSPMPQDEQRLFEAWLSGDKHSE